MRAYMILALILVSSLVGSCTSQAGQQPTAAPKATQALAQAAAQTPVATSAATASGTVSPAATSAAATAKLTAKDPAKDPLPSEQHLADAIKLGYGIFTKTPENASAYVGNDLSCTNCHRVGGQQEGALPLAGIAAVFPQYNGRGARIISLEDRINGCMQRSENGKPFPADGKELMAVASYLTWISDGLPIGKSPAWRGKNTIAQANQIPVDQLDPKQGQKLYDGSCAACHGKDGKGTASAPPVWGDRSYNDGAGMGRVYSAAGFVRYAMPLTAPGSLSDQDAQQLAAFIDAQDRPSFANKEKDYAGSQPPVDAVYYPNRYPQNPLKAKLQ